MVSHRSMRCMQAAAHPRPGRDLDAYGVDWLPTAGSSPAILVSHNASRPKDRNPTGVTPADGACAHVHLPLPTESPRSRPHGMCTMHAYPMDRPAIPPPSVPSPRPETRCRQDWQASGRASWRCCQVGRDRYKRCVLRACRLEVLPEIAEMTVWAVTGEQASIAEGCFDIERVWS